MGEPSVIRLATVLGAVVATERTASGLTQQRLATLATMHPMALSKIERGVQQDIGVETLHRIAGALSQTGADVTASGLLATAETWQERLRADDVGGLAGPALAARITLLG